MGSELRSPWRQSWVCPYTGTPAFTQFCSFAPRHLFNTSETVSQQTQIRTFRVSPWYLKLYIVHLDAPPRDVTRRLFLMSSAGEQAVVEHPEERMVSLSLLYPHRVNRVKNRAASQLSRTLKYESTNNLRWERQHRTTTESQFMPIYLRCFWFHFQSHQVMVTTSHPYTFPLNHEQDSPANHDISSRFDQVIG